MNSRSDAGSRHSRDHFGRAARLAQHPLRLSAVSSSRQRLCARAETVHFSPCRSRGQTQEYSHLLYSGARSPRSPGERSVVTKSWAKGLVGESCRGTGSRRIEVRFTYVSVYQMYLRSLHDGSWLAFSDSVIPDKEEAQPSLHVTRPARRQSPGCASCRCRSHRSPLHRAPG